MAIVLAFSSAEIFVYLAEHGEPRSFFMKLTANLVHFIAVQVTALTVSIFSKMSATNYLEWLSTCLLFYAVLVTFSAGLQLFQTARIYNAQASLSVKSQGPQASGHWMQRKRRKKRRLQRIYRK
jgi:hypothetical protein